MMAGIRDEDGLLPSVDDMCWLLHTNFSDMLADLLNLQSKGLIDQTDDTKEWVVVNWTKRQKREVTPGAIRMRRHREHKAEVLREMLDSDASQVTSQNVTNVTLQTPQLSASASTSLININAFKLYEDEIGEITPSAAYRVSDAVDEFGEEWVIEAIRVAADNNARKWSYVEAVLKRWKVEGFKSKTNGKKSDAEIVYSVPEYAVVVDDDHGQPQEITPADELWRKVLDQLKQQVPKAAFDDFIKPIVPLGLEDGRLRVRAMSEYHADWLHDRMRKTIDKMLTGMMNKKMSIEIEVEL